MGAKRLAGVIRVDCLFLDSNRVIDIFVLLFSRHGRPQLTEYPKVTRGTFSHVLVQVRGMSVVIAAGAMFL
jgi:hypothetical protein